MVKEEIKIRAKFKVYSVVNANSPIFGGQDLLTPESAEIKQDFVQEVYLQPVHSGSEENKSFSKYTPNGELHMVITNPNVEEFFIEGKEYYLDITPA